MSFEKKVTSNRPYLIRALYDWLIENQLTPYLMINANYPNTKVPKNFVGLDGRIVLNISESAVSSLNLGNQKVEFIATFHGVNEHIALPVKAIQAIYAFEDSRYGMVFPEDHDEDDLPPSDKPSSGSSTQRGRSHLRVVE